ncbi:MAG: DUF4249 family protein [Bacteroidales bacterium]|nr:DUF4249 family protein [Bacteroidales bacterium]
MLTQKDHPLLWQFMQLLIIGTTLLSQTSCRELVQDEFQDFTPVPTINSFIMADSIIKLNISLADKLDSFPLTTVENAEVDLFVDGEFEENLSSEGNGWYYSTSNAIAGSGYNCKVRIEGYDDISCTDSIPLPDSILNIEHILNAGKDEEGLSYPAVKVTFSNETNSNRYYQLIINIYKYEIWRTAYMKDIVDPVLLSEGLPLMVFSNERIEGDSYTMTINYSTGSYGSTNHEPTRMHLYPFVIELRSISYDYYLYLRQLYLYEKGRFPEFGEGTSGVFPLHSNIENGHGIFAGYSKTLSEIIDPENDSL